MFKIALGIIMGFAITSFSACSNEDNKTEQQVETNDSGHDGHHNHDAGHDHAGDHGHHDHAMHGDSSASTYVCPMFCEGSESEEAGSCPVCGMKLELRTELEKKDEGNGGDH